MPRDLEDTQATGYKFISGGAAYNLTLPFYPDFVEVFNYTQSGTTAKIVASRWFRGFPAGDAISVQSVTDNGTTANVSSALETTNGFTWAGAATAFATTQKTISGATQASPVVVTATAHGLSNGDRVRITDVTGMVELNNNEYVLANVATNTFELNDVYGNNIDGTGYTAYVSGGEANASGPTDDVENVAETYILTLGTGVVGADSDVMYVHAVKYPRGISDLGDIG
jgi:hypothetical protein